MQTLLPLIVGIALLHFGRLYFPQSVSDATENALNSVANKTEQLPVTKGVGAVVLWVIIPSLMVMLLAFWLNFIAVGVLHFIAATVIVMWVLSALRDSQVELKTESQQLVQAINELSAWFWILIFGPGGAVASLLIYYFVRNDSLSAGHHSIFKRSETLWQWVPARLIALSFALSGHFVKTFSIWRGLVLDKSLSAHSIVEPCLSASVGEGGAAEEVQDCILRTRMIWFAALILMLLSQIL